MYIWYQGTGVFPTSLPKILNPAMDPPGAETPGVLLLARRVIRAVALRHLGHHLLRLRGGLGDLHGSGHGLGGNLHLHRARHRGFGLWGADMKGGKSSISIYMYIYIWICILFEYIWCVDISLSRKPQQSLWEAADHMYLPYKVESGMIVDYQPLFTKSLWTMISIDMQKYALFTTSFRVSNKYVPNLVRLERLDEIPPFFPRFGCAFERKTQLNNELKQGWSTTCMNYRRLWLL